MSWTWLAFRIETNEATHVDSAVSDSDIQAWLKWANGRSRTWFPILQRDGFFIYHNKHGHFIMAMRKEPYDYGSR